jgi:hypothetical protein
MVSSKTRQCQLQQQLVLQILISMLKSLFIQAEVVIVIASHLFHYIWLITKNYYRSKNLLKTLILILKFRSKKQLILKSLWPNSSLKQWIIAIYQDSKLLIRLRNPKLRHVRVLLTMLKMLLPNAMLQKIETLLSVIWWIQSRLKVSAI